jgi:HEAT repeat protein
VLSPPNHDDFDSWVIQLEDPVRARRAYWHLVLSGGQALPAIRKGLTSPIDDVRRLCTRVLDHLVDEDSFPTLIEMLDDPDPRTRVEALHALACDRCTDNGCRPDASAVLDRAIRLLRTDVDRHVRERACEVVGRWVHEHEAAANALAKARDADPSPSVRKKASWYAPGGTIFAKTTPRSP